ncbi:uncharacterized protein LOC135832783 [Planococcus citri]|uniref:uncharacterized protein LOC135832783 n=1 Tax=Planococcus citri TaxID=170843 RepID=UPI0031F96BC5
MDQNKVVNVLQEIGGLNLSDKYTVYISLLNDLKNEEGQLVEHCQNVHSFDFLKNLLRTKKEFAIRNLTTVLPLLKTRDVDTKNLILKILPVMFSYVTLYDTEINNVFKICDIIRVHPAFSSDQELFTQWLLVFERRRENPDRKFLYKEEFYFHELPKLKTDGYCTLANSIGYGDIVLLRTVHRWLRVLRLHKYLYFFCNLSYDEIISINSCNIGYFENTVGVTNMTVGARNKILREVQELRYRQARLKSIIEKRHFNATDLEDAARELKRIMRSPISSDKETVLIRFLMNALKKVSDTLYALIGSSEKIIPLYGLIISILKEAYNYSFFNAAQKEKFNLWRSQLSAKINKTTSNFDTISHPIAIRQRDDYDYFGDDDESDDNFSNQSLSPIDRTEIIAIQMANFVLL